MTTTTIGKGAVRSKRRQRRDRYRGCGVCGDLGEKHCLACRAVLVILATERPPSLVLVVDGGYVSARADHLDRPRLARPRYAALRAQIAKDHPDWEAAQIEAELSCALVGAEALGDGPGHGGAGLVLATATGQILASRACAFPAANSSDTEFQAVIRGARWAPGAVIYTDSESTCGAASLARRDLVVQFLPDRDRGDAHALAHQLSVEGRQRHAARVTSQHARHQQPARCHER